MKRLPVPALVLLLGVRLAGSVEAQPARPPVPDDGPELLPPSGTPLPAPPPRPWPPPGPGEDDRDRILPPDGLSVAAAGAGPPVVVGDTTEETAAPPPPRQRAATGLTGPVGLLRTSSTEVGNRGEVRLGLTGELANVEDFLVKGSRNRRLAGTLAAGVTVTRRLELFGALLASSNRNDRCAADPPCMPEPDRVDPPVIRAFGDLVLGAKVAAPIQRTSGLRLGVEAGLKLYAGHGLSFERAATSGWLSALAGWDLRALALPIVLHTNVGFFKDNSRALQDGAGFDGASLPSRQVAAFAYGIGRDRLRGTLAVSAPIEKPGRPAALEPFVEYHVEVVTAEADPAYRAFAPPSCVSPTACAGNRDQHWLSFGLRTFLTHRLALLAGVDLAVRSPGYPFGSALLPFNVLFGLRQSLGSTDPPPRVRTRTITLERRVTLAPQPARGQADVTVSAPGFQPQVVSAPVVDGQTTPVAVTLVPVAPTAEVAQAPPLRLEGGRVVTSAPITFDPAPAARTTLSGEARAALDQLARQLGATAVPARIRIEAHWDNGLPRAEAEALTRQQAEAVAAYLIERGVPRDRLEPLGRGSNRPKVPNLGPSARAKNRRLELIALP